MLHKLYIIARDSCNHRVRCFRRY